MRRPGDGSPFYLLICQGDVPTASTNAKFSPVQSFSGISPDVVSTRRPACAFRGRGLVGRGHDDGLAVFDAFDFAFENPSSGGLIKSSAKLIANSGAWIFSRPGPGS